MSRRIKREDDLDPSSRRYHLEEEEDINDNDDDHDNHDDNNETSPHGSRRRAAIPERGSERADHVASWPNPPRGSGGGGGASSSGMASSAAAAARASSYTTFNLSSRSRRTQQQQQQHDNNHLLKSLLKRLRQYNNTGGGHGGTQANGDNNNSSDINVHMAKYLLEASGGNVNMAATLYIDDMLANQANVNQQQPHHHHNDNNNNLGESSSSSHNHRDDENSHDNMFDQETEDDNGNDDDDDDDDESSSKLPSRQHSRNQNRNNNRGSSNDNSIINKRLAVAARNSASSIRRRHQNHARAAEGPLPEDAHNRRVRQRLEQQFDHQVAANDDAAGVPGRIHMQHHAQVAPVAPGDRNQQLDPPEENIPVARADFAAVAVRAVAALPALPPPPDEIENDEEEEAEEQDENENNNNNNNNNNQESVSVSDDELGGSSSNRSRQIVRARGHSWRRRMDDNNNSNSNSNNNNGNNNNNANDNRMNNEAMGEAEDHNEDERPDRRRLQRHQRRQHPVDNNEPPPQPPRRRVSNHLPQRRRRGEDEDGGNRPPPPQRHQEERHVSDNGEEEPSSDDDTDSGANAANDDGDRKPPAVPSNIDNQQDAANESNKEQHEEEQNNDDPSSDVSYLSEDDDWSLEDDEEELSIKIPLNELWGHCTTSGKQPPKKEKQNSRQSRDNNDASGTTNNGDRNNNSNGNEPGDPSMAEDGGNGEGEGHFGIPDVWMIAGFTMSTCGTGLAAKVPPEEEAYYLHLQSGGGSSNSNNNNNPPPPPPPHSNNLPPHHCHGVTSLLSIVTGLLYTGASIQGSHVNCTTARKPFVELSEKERIQEFDSRLVDALSALLYVAAKASINRRQRSIERKVEKELADQKQAERLIDAGGDANDKNNNNNKSSSKPKLKDTTQAEIDAKKKKQQEVQRRLRLCPTCRWDEDSTNTESRVPEGRDAGQQVRISTSFSSIYDIRSYVLSNIRAFTNRGGCALFLETIVRIHGKKCVTRMIHRARQKASATGSSSTCSDGVGGDGTASLAAKRTPKTKQGIMVSCSCEEYQKMYPQSHWSSSSPAGTFSSTLLNSTNKPSIPPRDACVSIELISLLLSGKVHCSFKGWSTGGLGLGFLTNKSGQVGRTLMRPEKPVWVVKNDNSYSVLWLDNQKESFIPEDIAQLDRAGTLFYLTHWNCWYAQRHKSGMRVITARGKWVPQPQNDECLISSWDDSKPGRSVTESIMARRIRKLILEAGVLAGPSKVNVGRRTQHQQEQQGNIAATHVVSEDNADDEEMVDAWTVSAGINSSRSTVKDGGVAGRNKESMNITNDEVDQVSIHPDDMAYYPKEYRRWRFDLGSVNEQSNESSKNSSSSSNQSSENALPRVDTTMSTKSSDSSSRSNASSTLRKENWVPYFRLTSRQKLLVEMKLAPKINRVLWTRWPQATVDKFTPEFGSLPTV